MQLSQADYELMLEIFKTTEICNNPDKINEEIARFDAEIDSLLADTENDEQDRRQAVDILLQGRNFLAIHLGQTQRDVIFAEDLMAVLSDPIVNRHVAVCLPQNTHPSYIKALEKGIALQRANCKIYVGTKPVLHDLKEGLICGLIGIHFAEPIGLIAEQLRHDMQYHPQYSVELARNYVFPPSVNFGAPHLIALIFQAASQMHNVTFNNEGEDFNPEQQLSELVPHMAHVKSQLSIAVFDDDEQIVTPLLTILRAWPGIVVDFIRVSDSLPLIPSEYNIVLLDEAMDRVTGSQIAEKISTSGCETIIASISGGHCPNYTPHHFGLKAVMKDNRQACLDFIAFMNRLFTKF